jgi:predicted transcriptional regulator
VDSWTIKLPRALSERVARLAKKRHVSRSALVREALERLAEGSEAETFVERASRHVGAGKDLPADLLTNPRHMRGYGR